jgi:chromosomal replication initiator protein
VDSIEQALPAAELAAPPPAEPDVSKIQEAVANRFSLTVDAILSPDRTATVARARQLAMYLTRELTGLSLPAIAEAFNRRDHTTVLHAIRKVERCALEDASLSRTLEELGSALRSETAMDRDRTD